jgi:hypothetical protein
MTNAAAMVNRQSHTTSRSAASKSSTVHVTLPNGYTEGSDCEAIPDEV